MENTQQEISDELKRVFSNHLGKPVRQLPKEEVTYQVKEILQKHLGVRQQQNDVAVGTIWSFMGWRERLKWYWYSKIMWKDARYVREQFYERRALFWKLNPDSSFLEELPTWFESNPKETLQARMKIMLPQPIQALNVEITI